VSASEIERALQDYLDGRMSDDERSAFETRLARDRDLAERVAFSREVGDGLREADVGLSPGFHARARARFEESQAPSRRWIVPLVWSAGIATAALFTAIVLLPSLTQRDPVEESTVARLEKFDKEQDESTSRQQVPPPEPTSVAVPADADSPVPAAEGEGAPVASDEPPGARKDELMKQVAAAPKRKSAEPVLQETADVVVGGAQSVEAETEIAAAEPVPGTARGFAQLDAASAPVERSRREKSDAGGKKGAPAAAADSWIQFPVAESFVVPAGRLATGEVRIIDNASAWSEFSDLPATYSPARRIVLIGPRARPLLCADIVLRVEVDRRIVLLPLAAEDAAGPRQGCGIQVPADALEIVVLDMSEDGS